MKFINNYSASVEIGAEDTSLALDLPDGKYRLTITDNASPAPSREIVDATVAGGVATLERGREGTAAQEWAAGSIIYCAVTAGVLEELYARPPAPPGENGRSAYDIAVDNGFIGPEEAWLESLKGADAPKWAAVGSTVTVSRDMTPADAGLYLPVDSAAAVTLTLPGETDTAWPSGCEIHVQQIGGGQVELSPASGVTIISEETLRTRKQGSAVTLKRLSPDLWTVVGSLEAAE